jgi:hypothetical protein
LKAAWSLTVADHLGVGDHAVEEGQHLYHLVVPLTVGFKAHPEGLRDVVFEELGINGVDDLQGEAGLLNVEGTLTLKR